MSTQTDTQTDNTAGGQPMEEQTVDSYTHNLVSRLSDESGQFPQSVVPITAAQAESENRMSWDSILDVNMPSPLGDDIIIPGESTLYL
jgi:hypothetical protein